MIDTKAIKEEINGMLLGYDFETKIGILEQIKGTLIGEFQSSITDKELELKNLKKKLPKKKSDE